MKNKEDEFATRIIAEIKRDIKVYVKDGLMDHQIYKIYNDKYPENYFGFVDVVEDILEKLDRDEILPDLIFDKIENCKSTKELSLLFSEILASFDDSFFDHYGILNHVEEKEYDLKELEEDGKA